MGRRGKQTCAQLPLSAKQGLLTLPTSLRPPNTAQLQNGSPHTVTCLASSKVRPWQTEFIFLRLSLLVAKGRQAGRQDLNRSGDKGS